VGRPLLVLYTTLRGAHICALTVLYAVKGFSTMVVRIVSVAASVFCLVSL